MDLAANLMPPIVQRPYPGKQTKVVGGGGTDDNLEDKLVIAPLSETRVRCNMVRSKLDILGDGYLE